MLKQNFFHFQRLGRSKVGLLSSLKSLQIYTVWNSRLVFVHDRSYKSHGFHGNLLNRKVPQFVLAFRSLKLRSALFGFKSYHEFSWLFLCGHLYWLGHTIRDTFALTKSRIEVHHKKFLKGSRDSFILMDSVVVYIHFRRIQPHRERFVLTNFAK